MELTKKVNRMTTSTTLLLFQSAYVLKIKKPARIEIRNDDVRRRSVTFRANG